MDSETPSAQVPEKPVEKPIEETSPATTPKKETPAEQPGKPTQYVTAEQMEQFADRIVTQTVRRVNQSASDRDRFIKTEIGKVKGLLEQSGAKLTPEQESTLRDNIEKQFDEAGADSQEQGPGAESPAAFIEAQAKRVFQKVGVTVEPGDPQWKKIDEALKDPNGSVAETLLAIKDAAEEKKALLASNKANASLRSPDSAGSQPAGPKEFSSANEAWENAYSKK